MDLQVGDRARRVAGLGQVHEPTAAASPGRRSRKLRCDGTVVAREIVHLVLGRAVFGNVEQRRAVVDRAGGGEVAAKRRHQLARTVDGNRETFRGQRRIRRIRVDGFLVDLDVDHVFDVNLALDLSQVAAAVDQRQDVVVQRDVHNRSVVLVAYESQKLVFGRQHDSDGNRRASFIAKMRINSACRMVEIAGLQRSKQIVDKHGDGQVCTARVRDVVKLADDVHFLRNVQRIAVVSDAILIVRVVPRVVRGRRAPRACGRSPTRSPAVRSNVRRGNAVPKRRRGILQETIHVVERESAARRFGQLQRRAGDYGERCIKRHLDIVDVQRRRAGISNPIVAVDLHQLQFGGARIVHVVNRANHRLVQPDVDRAGRGIRITVNLEENARVVVVAYEFFPGVVGLVRFGDRERSGVEIDRGAIDSVARVRGHMRLVQRYGEVGLGQVTVDAATRDVFLDANRRGNVVGNQRANKRHAAIRR